MFNYPLDYLVLPRSASIRLSSTGQGFLNSLSFLSLSALLLYNILGFLSFSGHFKARPF